MTQLECPRLILREFLRTDWAEVHEYAKDPDVVRYMEWGPNRREDTMNFIDAALSFQKDRPRRNYELAVIHKIDKRLIGACGIRLSPDPLQADFGYCYNKQYWQQGYAKEAAAKIVEFGFEKLGLHRIIAMCDVENIASAKVLESLGMRREGHFIQDAKIRDVYRDSYLYAILASEWRQKI